MNLIQLPTLHNEQSLVFKFVVINKSLHDTNEVGYILRGSCICEFHREIVQQTRFPKYTCIGGGRIRLTSTELEAYGESMDFGIVSNEVVREILSDYCKGNNLTLITKMGVGY